MQIPNQFLEDEVRDGFFISSKIKRAWANGLWLLAELDRICEQNNIKYSLDWGTLLGAIRHGGIIPWDDDFDVVMHRNELKKFINACNQDNEIAFNFITFENNDYHWKFIVSISHNERMCFEPEYLKEHFNFPYISSIDIFVLDNVSDDEDEERIRDERVRKLLNIDSGIEHGDFSKEQLKTILTIIEEEFGEKISGKEDINSIRRKILRLALVEMQKFNDIETKNVSQIVPFGMNGQGIYPREFYEKTMKVPFEDIELAVPIYVDEILKRKYGEYQRIVKGTAGHGYPFFESQRASLGEDIDIYPRYKCEDVGTYEYNNSASLKQITIEYLEHLEEIKHLLISIDELDSAAVCQDEQEVAIDFGTLVESVKGEGIEVVAYLEKYCEQLYYFNEGGCELAEVIQTVNDIASSAKKCIIDRKEVVFMAYKAECWDSWNNIWVELNKNKDEETDIYILPIPYGYKEYDGTVAELVCDNVGYPKDAVILNYELYDFSLHCPDEVYIQFPYDQYNTTISVLPQLYISTIRPFVRNLIYVPCLRVGEFESGDSIQKYNIKDYVCSPGVALADKIILDSDKLKDRYIDILTEWAGEDTQNMWVDKITVNDVVIVNKGQDEKRLLLYCSVSSLLYYKEKYIHKIEDNIRTIAQKGINTIVKMSPEFLNTLRAQNQELVGAWNCVMDEIAKTNNVIIDTESSADLLSEYANAYYGEVSIYSTKMLFRRKPLMIRGMF